MRQLRLEIFLSQLSEGLFVQQDSFEMAKLFGRLVLKGTNGAEAAVLVWPDAGLQDELQHTEVLGKKAALKGQRVFSARFREEGHLFFRIDFYHRRSAGSVEFRKYFEMGQALVARAILANEARAQNDELTRFRWLRHLSAGLSHELNTPLTTLAFHVKKLAHGNALIESARQVQKALGAIGGVLGQYRSLSGDGQFTDLKEVSSSELMKKMEQHLQAEFSAKKDWFVFKPDTRGGVQVAIQTEDILRLTKVLCQNSIDAIQLRGAGPKPCIEIAFRSTKAKLQIKITDNGQGISRENRSLVFAPFFSTKDVNEGRGLGLSLARAVAFVNNGHLRLNRLSEKTQFVLEFPILRPASANRRRAA